VDARASTREHPPAIRAMPGLVPIRRAILAVLATTSVHAAVEVMTAENFAEKSHEPVAWLLHLDSGLDELAPLVANCGKYFGTLFPQKDVRVGHVDLDSQPQLRQVFCGGAAVCPPLVLLPLWSGGRGRLQQQKSKVYTGQPSLIELVQFVKLEKMPSGGASDGAQAGRAQAAPMQGQASATTAELQAWLQTKPALLAAMQAGQLSASQMEQVKQLAQQDLAQQRAAARAESEPSLAARGGGGGSGGGGGGDRQSERPDVAGGKGGDLGSTAGRGGGAEGRGRALGDESGDPFRLDTSAGKRGPKRRTRGPAGRRGAAAKKRQWWCLWLCRK